jgi:uncharacterized protein (DUF302 family)
MGKTLDFGFATKGQSVEQGEVEKTRREKGIQPNGFASAPILAHSAPSFGAHADKVQAPFITEVCIRTPTHAAPARIALFSGHQRVRSEPRWKTITTAMKIIALLLTLLVFQTKASAQNEISPSSPVMSHPITVQHIAVASRRDFATTIREFESRLGTFNPESVKTLATPNPDVESVRSKLEAMAGSSGFMRFGPVRAMGDLLPLVGKPVGRANQYLVGNPLFAVQMTQYHPGAGLYAPLRIVIYEDAGGVTHFEYDLPSSLFGQFQDERITKVALMLDKKMEDLVTAAGGR